jgi:hypothetical protein
LIVDGCDGGLQQATTKDTGAQAGRLYDIPFVEDVADTHRSTTHLQADESCGGLQLNAEHSSTANYAAVLLQGQWCDRSRIAFYCQSHDCPQVRLVIAAPPQIRTYVYFIFSLSAVLTISSLPVIHNTQDCTPLSPAFAVYPLQAYEEFRDPAAFLQLIEKRGTSRTRRLSAV